MSIFEVLKKSFFGSFGYPQITESTDYAFKRDFCNRETDLEGFQYKTGLIFYMDILGCRGLSLKSGSDDISLTKVKKIVDIFQDIEKQYEDDHWGKGYKMPFSNGDYTVDKYLGETNIEVTMSLFSDSIIVSYYPEPADRFLIWYEQMHQIFNDICRTLYLFAQNGLFLRGGMSYGKFYHCDNACFGPALLEAVKLEDEICYPTIAICDSFRERIHRDLTSKEIDDFSPGYKSPYELKSFAEDFFSIFLNSTMVDGQAKMMLDWLLSLFYYDLQAIEVMEKAIIEELNSNYPEKIRKKYEWLAEQFNRSLDGLHGLGISRNEYRKIHIN